jgi:hypothetical protein
MINNNSTLSAFALWEMVKTVRAAISTLRLSWSALDLKGYADAFAAHCSKLKLIPALPILILLLSHRGYAHASS